MTGAPRTAEGVYHADGSGRATTRWLLDLAAKDLGSRRVRSAIIEAVTTGAASVE